MLTIPRSVVREVKDGDYPLLVIFHWTNREDDLKTTTSEYKRILDHLSLTTFLTSE